MPGGTDRLDLVIAVEDTGVGIPPESTESIFEAFRQQDGQSTKQFGGTGLGLAITKRLVEMMGGGIRVKSRVGKGSRFEIILRNVEVAAHAPPRGEEDMSQWEGVKFEPATILVVDDIESNRKLVAEYLDNSDISVIEAGTGEKAISLAVRHMPDVILMDIRMPVMDGYETLKRIRSVGRIKHLPVIAVTASGMMEDRERVAESGFEGFLAKPVKRTDLFRALAAFIPHSVPRGAGNHSLLLRDTAFL